MIVTLPGSLSSTPLLSSRLLTPALSSALSTSAAASVPSEHLVWQDGFAPKLASAVVACGAAAVVARFVPVHAQLARALHRAELWVVLALASSSCCLLQLALNLLSVGCAGFNTWLGPARPYTMGATASLQVWLWRSTLAAGRPIAWPLGATLLTALLTFLPELTWWYAFRAPAAVGGGGADEVRLAVTGMGCAACAAKVKSTLLALDDVAAVRAISVEDGVANVRVRAGAIDRDLEREAREALSGTGFGLGGLERPASSP